MKERKKEMIHFVVQMRNGFAFCTAWFLILVLLVCYIYNQQTISVNSLVKLLVLIVGGVFIFNLLFTRILIRKWSFTRRLTIFMLSISIYECAGFYWLGFFRGKGTFVQWIMFVGIVCGLYFCCIAIYRHYSKRQGEIYTQALKKYQQQRGITIETD